MEENFNTAVKSLQIQQQTEEALSETGSNATARWRDIGGTTNLVDEFSMTHTEGE